MSTLKFAAPSLPYLAEQSGSKQESSFIAVSPAICRLLDQVAIVAPHLRIAALEGETGTGKHAVARLLYEGYAARHPEIEQWGFSRYDAREWLLSYTDPQSLVGFVLLDRVDLLAAPGQSMLLRVLKELDFRRSGTLAVIVSSESPLRESAREGDYLSELAMRLTTVRLAIPPLRDRKSDIVPLANLFLDRIAAHYQMPPVVLTASATARLLEHSWPGNICELSSILESAVVECSNGIIRGEDLTLPTRQLSGLLPRGTSELLNLDAVIHYHILRVLDLNKGNKLRTARQLGISRSTLYRLLDKRLSFSG